MDHVQDVSLTGFRNVFGMVSIKYGKMLAPNVAVFRFGVNNET